MNVKATELTRDNLKTIKAFARLLAKRPQDVDDVVQEVSIMYVKNPTTLQINNTFLFTLTRRARYNHYYLPNRRGKRDLEVYGEAYDTGITTLIEVVDPEQLIIEKQLIEKVRNFPRNLLSLKEKELLDKICKGYEPGYEDRTHFNNLQKKIQKGIL